MNPLIEQVLGKYPERVKVVFKNFPLDMHPMARKAAAAAMAAYKQDKFWQYHDAAFKNSAGLNDAKLRQMAQEAGLDMAAYDKAIADPAVLALVDRDMKDGRAAGVQGTPTIFINGRLLTKRNPEGFFEVIDRLLKK